MRKSPSLKNVAYVAVMIETFDPCNWGVSICVEGERGHRPLSDYAGPYTESRAKGIAMRLNKRLGIEAAEARRVVLSTMTVWTGSSRHATSEEVSS